jgi:hypothetical protein
VSRRRQLTITDPVTLTAPYVIPKIWLATPDGDGWGAASGSLMSYVEVYTERSRISTIVRGMKCGTSGRFSLRRLSR